MPAKANFFPSVQRLHGGEPLLQRIPHHPWENKVTFNPAAILVDDRFELDRIISGLPFSKPVKEVLTAQPALCFLLYRAQGNATPSFDYTRSSLGLAVLSPTLELLARHDKPLITPEHDFENLGIEDGRLTKVDDRFFLYYCAYSSGTPANRIRIAVASSRDFIHWEKHGLVPGDLNTVDNKNAMLFPVRVGGKFLLLHRPMSGPDAMCIHWAEAESPLGTWKSRGVLMRPLPNPAFRETWIGGGAPPILLPDGRFLIIYHIGNWKFDGTREYDLGICIADPDDPDFMVKRREPFMTPTTAAETTGDADLGVNNVVFICAAYFYNGDLYFPYAGADSVVLAACVRNKEITSYLAPEP